ncbi:MAG TPA: hypothetical protein VGB45_15010 [Abditibacterium sp.]|jgi:hypothetical protein
MLETPVAFLIFNRPDLTQRVFAAIAAQKPKHLLVVADGPRHEAEAELCQKTRSILEQVDWPCQVQTNFSEVNLGCKRRVSSGLDWVFENVEEAIILEDDCLPNPSFFDFCCELLEKYRDEDQIMMISGNNFQNNAVTQDSYYYSRYTHIWGWASWRRAWAHYDVEMKMWPTFKQLNKLPFKKHENRHWENTFDSVWRGEIDTWDFQWQFALWDHNALSVLPTVNLVTNLGFDSRGSHTVDSSSPFANMKSQALGEWRFPTQIRPHFTADQISFRKVFAPATPARTPVQRVKNRLRTIWQSL